MIIISDTSPIANLILIDQLEILRQVFKKIVIPPTVNKEIKELEQFDIDLQKYNSCDWIIIKTPSNELEVMALKKQIDPGESEAISLAKELQAKYLLIDERIGTKKANEFGLQTIGLLGVIAKAKEEKYIESVKPIIFKLRKVGFWISDKLIEVILKRVGEQ